MKRKAAIFAVFIFMLGCRKDSSNIVFSTTLTACPLNYTCTYNYYDQADVDSNGQLIKGSYRVFWYKTATTNVCAPYQQFYVKTSLAATGFMVTSAQIASGQITAYDFKCPCCASAFLSKPISGVIKGKKIDLTHWLINGAIVFDSPSDTVEVNQYFSLTRLP